jgi:hypothetical protein
MVAGEHPGLAEEVLNGVADEKLKRQIGRRLEAGELRTPRIFFWDKAV